jgi:hypothetical protein
VKPTGRIEVYMQPFSFIRGGELPAYHEGILILKVRPTIAPLAAALTTTGAAESLLASAGMSALSLFERGGMVKQVTPLARQADQERTILAAPGAAAIIAGTTGGPSAEDPNAGVSLVELERDADVPTLQSALANDPYVEFVSRLPVRYLAAQNPPPWANE